MMNKGLEVIEAHWLFGAPAERIEVVIHPESVIHSMVAYVDGSVLAQLGNPDMRTPIAHAMAYPERVDAGVRPLDLFAVGQLNFERPDLERFPCLALAYRALKESGVAPAVLNAANEVAVADFLEGGLRFDRIASVIEATLDKIAPQVAESLEVVFDADRQARQVAAEFVGRYRS
jgi:1-deoxy-D-xylulose-5-phosphate reductoisomerase